MDRQTFENKVVELANELMDGFDNGDFEDYKNIPLKYKWKHLSALEYLSPSIEGGDEFYRKIYNIAIKFGMYTVKEKIKRGEKVNVAFQSYSAAQWPAGGVYERIAKDDRFDVKVFAAPLVDRDRDSRIDSYTQTYNWFKTNGYKVFGGLDIENDRTKSWDEAGGYPDVLYVVSSWNDILSENQNYLEMPLNTLIGFIDYGMNAVENKDGSYEKEYIYNKNSAGLMWKIYCDLEKTYEKYQKYNILHGKNALYTGYPKMDYFYQDRIWKKDEVEKLWKIPDGMSEKAIKKIIIAPHFSVHDNAILKFATFKQNKWFWIYLMKKYGNISFVFKPHPNLRAISVEEGVFKTYEDYDNYLKQIDDLPNAKVVTESSYLEYFATSDGMILDSCSFLVEYMYTKKPLLFLRRDTQYFTDVGEEILKENYTASGEDYFGIEKFITEVILGEKDTKKEKRDQIFKNELDYKGKLGNLASENIYQDLIKSLFEIS